MNLTLKHVELLNKILQQLLVDAPEARFVTTDDEDYRNFIEVGGVVVRNTCINEWTPHGRNEVPGFAVEVHYREPDRQEQPGMVNIIEMGTYRAFGFVVKKVFDILAEWRIENVMQPDKLDLSDEDTWYLSET